MGHLPWSWAIQGTELQQKASGGKWMIFNLCQKICVPAAAEQGKAVLGTKTWRNDGGGCAQTFAIQCTNTKCQRTVFSTGPLLKSSGLRGEAQPSWWYCQHSAKDRCRDCESLWVEMALLYVLGFCCAGKLLKIPRWLQKKVHIPLGKGGAEPEPCFHSLDGKKNPPSLNSLFWWFNSMLWSEHINPQSIWLNCNAPGS